MSTSVKREMAVFDAALEIADPEERQRFLERTCDGDEKLRASIEDLLKTQAPAEQFFSQVASSLNSLASQFAEAAAPVEVESQQIFEEKPGAILGRYKVVQKIGEGGCGIVYLAEQEHPVRRRVALKVIKLGMDTKSVIARFEAERQALAIMEHPNIARVFDAGATNMGRPYFVMELVNGTKITEYCDQNRLGIEQRLELFIQICKAIQHAHQKGIIHRDIKPSNILVTAHDGAPAIKVIDFGIAKATEDRLTDKTMVTAYAQVIGTPAYMSPEQVGLDGLDLDTRSDIYSLGVLLYELLTGQTPFDSKELTRFGVDEMRRTLRERQPRPPSARLMTLHGEDLVKAATRRDAETTRLVSRVRGDLDWIVMKALEKDRARRYDTANGLGMDVRRYLENEPVLARPPNRWYLLQKLVRRNRLAVVSGVAIAATLLIGAVTSTWLLVQERKAQRKVVAAEREAKSRGEAEMLGRFAQAKLLLEQHNFDAADKLLDGVVVENLSIDDAATLRQLGDWHALSSRWRQAAERLGLLVRADRADVLERVVIDYFRLGPALIESGDLNGYERSRQEAIARYAGTGSAYMDVVLKLSLLLPANQEVMKDLAPYAELLDRNHDPEFEAWRAVALALFEYRRGDFAKAAEWCNRCLADREYVASRSAAVEAILAMSRWQMNQREDALAALDQAWAMVAGKYNPGPDVKAGPEYFWFDRQFARILIRECEERFLEADHSLAQVSLLEPSLDHAAMFRVLGEWHVVRNEWRAAGDRFGALVKVNQGSSWEEATMDFTACGTTLAKLNDDDGYQRFRKEAIARFQGTDNKTIAARIIKISLLRPADDRFLAALAPLVAVVVRPFSGAEADLKEYPSYQAWSAVALGLMEYRRGNWAKAAEWCHRSMATSGELPLPNSVGRVILAMSLHQLGQDETARLELRQARDFIESNSNNVDLSNWRDRLFGSVLLGEATGLLPIAEQPMESKAR